MKPIAWRNADEMLFESGHRTFDQQSNLVTRGNVIANTQLSGHVRAYAELRCNSWDFEPGHLRNHDLDRFTRMPRHVRRWIERATQEQDAWVYMFFHSRGDGHGLTVHGWVITAKDHTLLQKFYTGPTWKSQLVVDEAAKYVSYEPGEQRE